MRPGGPYKVQLLAYSAQWALQLPSFQSLERLAPMGPEKGPEWRHVVIKNKPAKGLPDVQCIYCDKQFNGGPFRIRAHLLGTRIGVAPCQQVTPEAVTELRAEEESKKAAEEAKAKKRKLNAIGRSCIEAQAAGQQTTIRNSFSGQDKEAVHAAVSRFFYSCGISFNSARSPYFAEMIKAVNNAAGNYKAPGINALRDSLLQKEVERVKNKLEPLLASNDTTGCTITSDGWSSSQNKPLLNFLLVNAKGEVFLKAEDTSGKSKTAAYIAETWIDCIEEVGPDNVIQVVSDSAAACKAAGALVVERFPHITWTPCTAHCLDLLLEDIGSLAWAKDTIKEAKSLVHFLTNHHKSLAIFRTHSELELLKPAETRFATAFMLMNRLLEVKQALEETVVDREWRAWVESSSAALRDAAEEVKSLVMSVTFWRKMKELVAFSMPLVVLLRQVDSGKPIVGRIYWRMHEIKVEISELQAPANHRNDVVRLLGERWEMLHSPMHAAGFVLDPQYQTYDQHANEEVMEGFWDIVAKLAPSADHPTIVQQLQKYKSRVGLFGREVALNSVPYMPAYSWWVSFGAGSPELQSVAVKVLAQCSVASACERSWSTFDFIHSRRRNRLTPERANDLVYVFSNLRLLDKIEDVDYED